MNDETSHGDAQTGDLALELEQLRLRLAERQALAAREAWSMAEAAIGWQPVRSEAVELDEGEADQGDAAEDTDATEVGGSPSDERHVDEARLHESARDLFDAAPVALLRLDTRLTIRACNPLAQSLLGCEPSRLRGRPIADVIDAGDVAVVMRGLEALAAGRDPSACHRDVRIRRPAGRPIWAGLRAAALPAGRDDVRAILLALEDVAERRAVESSLRTANERLAERIAALELRSREHGLVSETGDLLQACRTADEAYGVIARMGRRLFASHGGSMAVAGPGSQHVEVVATWGTPSGEHSFGPDACWALRRGRPHLVQGPDAGPTCRHMPAPPDVAYLCVPMMAYGEAVGLLTISGPGASEVPDAVQRLAGTVAEHIALALANLKLQESLRRQSIRDPLTGLFNRRYMEESLAREMRRAGRARHPVGVIMLDLDHFKALNDSRGHEVGDALLREVGAVLQRSIRGEDIACRYGGEEFILILPEASLTDAAQRAEQIRDAIRAIEVVHGGRPVGPVTVSLGVAIFPDHGASAEALLRAADAALYRAKARGRDRVDVGVDGA